jgi:protoporphyrinogen oxidase
MGKTAIITGSGMAGIVSALLLKRKFGKVYLIEKKSDLGGLLYSYKTDGGEFDYGTHFLRDTGVSELDEILFGDMNPEKWLTLGNLKAGNYFCSKLNEKSPFVDTRLLPEEMYHKGMMQLLSSGEEKGNYINLEERLNDTLGETFTKNIYQVVTKKLLGHELREFSPGLIGIIALLTRVIGFTPEITRELKKTPLFDKKLAFHSSEEGQSSLKNYYPVKGGIGLWIDEIEKKLVRMGVEILKNTMVDRINHTNGNIDSVVLNNGNHLNCDQLIWTAPVYQCIKSSGLTPQFKLETPTRLITSIHNFVFDKPFLTDLYYFVCTDPDMPSFRITLYPNVQGISSDEKGYRITVEVLSLEKQDLGEIAKRVHLDLLKMGIVSEEAQIVFQQNDTLDETFPVPTHQFIKDSEMQLKFAKESLKNILFLGKNVGNTWFMQDILVETYNTVNSLLKEDPLAGDTTSISF